MEQGKISYTRIGIWDWYRFPEKYFAIYSNFRDIYNVELEILHLDRNVQKKFSCAQANIDNKEHCNTENLSISLNVSESILVNMYQNVTKKLKFTDYNST